VRRQGGAANPGNVRGCGCGCDDRAFSYEILVVDDCSEDKTVDVVMEQVRRHSADRIRLLRLRKNHGKGGAVRKGVMRAEGARILFADADNATQIRDYEKLARTMDGEHAAGKAGVVVCGSRAHLENQAIAKRNPLRNLLMHGFHVLVSTLCVRNVRDTQCGCSTARPPESSSPPCTLSVGPSTSSCSTSRPSPS
jgi:dolichyl-phosphate beta-glucosyltransferase